MIEKLDYYSETNEIGQVIAYSSPDIWTVIKKVNELVEAVNRLERQIEKLQVL